MVKSTSGTLDRELDLWSLYHFDLYISVDVGLW